MEKKIFEEPKCEVIEFDTEDVITTSGNETPIVPTNPMEIK